MAIFGSYFGLCPLIDHRSLLGVTTDSDIGNVLVTLGKNIAMQYRLADQKQIFSWTTKEKFTSPVIFDFDMNRYVAVFNQMCIKSWEYKDKNLDKLKKLKFNTDIENLIQVDNTSFVIFSNGAVEKLDVALIKHKSMAHLGFLGENDFIKDITSCSMKTNKYIGLLIGNASSNETSYILIFVFDLQGNKTDIPRIKLKRNSSNLIGCAFHIFDKQVELLTLWTDGKLYIKSLENKSDEAGEMFSTIESISCKDEVSLMSLDKDYIAIYGGNSNQEGALLVIYNMQFKVTQCRQPFKLLTVGAKIWPMLKNIILPVGQNLAVVPYHLEKEQLCALIGSHKMSQNTENKDVFIVQHLEETTWTKKIKKIATEDKKTKMELEVIAKQYLDQGYPESAIFQEILPQYIETNNISYLEVLIETFDDIPENYFIEVLQYFLNAPHDVFKVYKPYSNNFYPDSLQPHKRYEILTLILKKPINEIFLLPYLRAKLNLDEVLKLLFFILFLMVNDNLSDVNFIHKLIEWVNLILDAHYQTFILSKNEIITQILLSLSEFVNDELCHQEALQKLLSIVDQVNTKKKMKSVEKDCTVEKIDLL